MRLAGRVACVLAAALSMAAVTFAPAPPVVADDSPLPCDTGLVKETLANGAAWRMCSRIHPIKGLVLESIEFKPASGSYEYEGYKRVLDEIYLAQLNVPYDSGGTAYDDIPEFGFGDAHLMEQVPKLCGGEPANVSQAFMFRGQLLERTMPGICVEEVDTGLGTHSQEQEIGGGPHVVDQSTGLEVSSLSKISWYEYQQKVTFGDGGQIDVGLGATGDVAPGEGFFSADPAEGWKLGSGSESEHSHAVNHWHNAIYRVDFAIDSATRQTVEQWDYAQTGVARAPIVKGTPTTRTEAFSSVPGEHHDQLTWWRVVNPDSLNKDGHPRSYEIVNHNQTDHFSPITQPAVSFTNDHPCREYAVGNLNPDCPNQTVLDYVAEETSPLTDPVAWVNVGFHHIDRDEDQSPMPVHWQRFQLVPRDFFAQHPSIEPSRQCINGFMEGGVDSSARPCVATNQRRPTITADTSAIAPGTTLTANPGTWNTSRTTWNYSYLWFRNGAPIETATAATYVVTSADYGASLSVKVTASQTGFGSGTASSDSVRVVSAPRVAPAVTVVAPTSVMYGRTANAVVTVSRGATGNVTLAQGGRVLGTRPLVAGRVMFPLPRTSVPGRWVLRASYPGSAALLPASGAASYAVTKVQPRRVALTIAKKPTRHTRGRVVVRVEPPPGLPRPTGTVRITVRGPRGQVKHVTHVLHAAKARITLPRITGRSKVTAKYLGSPRYLSQGSRTIAVRTPRGS